MARNHGCPDCQRTCSQPAVGSNGYDDAITPDRARAVSPDNIPSTPAIYNPYYTGSPRTPVNAAKSNPIDRQEIIRRIKSRDSRPSSPELERSGAADRQDGSRQMSIGNTTPTPSEYERPRSSGYSRKRKSPVPRPNPPNPLTPLQSRPHSPHTQHQDNQSIGLEIERPRSALHRGDFRDRERSSPSVDTSASVLDDQSTAPFATSPVAPWHPEFPVAAFQQSLCFPPAEIANNDVSLPICPTRGRGVSSASLLSTFVYKAPTSPLVQSSRPDTPDFSQHSRSRSPDKSRRHTLAPQSLMNVHSSLGYSACARRNMPVPRLRSEKSFPYQAHQPRRSLNTLSSLPHTPFSTATRRPSLSGDSLLHFAPMVGSYEESILRGRMSTVPSRPLSFMAQIGVLGKGNCKPSLRCPPHVSVGFPAVFYSYGSGPKSPASDQPSPYVGLIDLENNLSSQQVTQGKRRPRIQEVRSNPGSRTSSPIGTKDDDATSDVQVRRRRRQKAKRRSGSPTAPPGGSYRIPQQGQLQIVIKNPNKTAVKLFLVPYDLSDMEPGQKTFIRQRSYSAGPVIDMPLSSRRNLGTDRPEAALSATDDPNDRPVLRYLIHLHICCPSKGRFFLYKSIRVVFANRVPDGKEKLRNEIQLPEPRYSTYKANRVSNLHVDGQAPAKDDLRRRSVVDQNIDTGPIWPREPRYLAQSLPVHEVSLQQGTPTPPLPGFSSLLPTLDSRPPSRHLSDGTRGSISPSTSSLQAPPSSIEADTPQRLMPQLQDPFSFQRNRSCERKTAVQSESLLSRRLMDLAVKSQGTEHERVEV